MALGLHQLSAMDLTPVELIETASAIGYDQVSLFTSNPMVPVEGKADTFVSPRVTADNRADILAAIPADAPVSVKLPRESRIKAGQPARPFLQTAYRLSRTLLDGPAQL